MNIYVAGPENVDLEDPEMQGVMPRAISQVRPSGKCHLDTGLCLPTFCTETGIQRAQAQALA